MSGDFQTTCGICGSDLTKDNSITITNSCKFDDDLLRDNDVSIINYGHMTTYGIRYDTCLSPKRMFEEGRNSNLSYLCSECFFPFQDIGIKRALELPLEELPLHLTGNSSDVSKIIRHRIENALESPEKGFETIRMLGILFPRRKLQCKSFNDYLLSGSDTNHDTKMSSMPVKFDFKRFRIPTVLFDRRS